MPTRWDYERDESVEGRGTNRRDIFSIKLTAQVSPRNRVTFSHEYQHRCSGGTITSAGGGCRGRGDDWIGLGTLTASPETWPGYHDFPYHVTQATWTSPLSNRVLLEAGFSRFQYLWAGFGIAPPDSLTSLIPVTESQADRRSSRELHVSRHVRSARFRMGEQRCEPEQLARVDGVRHRCAQPEDRVSGLVSTIAAGPGRQLHAAALYDEQPSAERCQLHPRDEVGAERPDGDVRALTFRISGRWAASRFRARCATTGHRAGHRPRAMARQRSRDSIPRPSPSRVR